jgi:hypothetical protein
LIARLAFKGRENCASNGDRFIQHVVAAKPQHVESTLPKILIALCVVFLGRLALVGCAVYLNHQTCVDTYEVDDIGSDLRLLAKVIAVRPKPRD